MVSAHARWHGDVALVVEPLPSPLGIEKLSSPSKIFAVQDLRLKRTQEWTQDFGRLSASHSVGQDICCTGSEGVSSETAVTPALSAAPLLAGAV